MQIRSVLARSDMLLRAPRPHRLPPEAFDAAHRPQRPPPLAVALARPARPDPGHAATKSVTNHILIELNKGHRR